MKAVDADKLVHHHRFFKEVSADKLKDMKEVYGKITVEEQAIKVYTGKAGSKWVKKKNAKTDEVEDPRLEVAADGTRTDLALHQMKAARSARDDEDMEDDADVAQPKEAR